MITFRIDSADIILNDLGDGKGKIIISDTSYGYDFSYFWGAMGNGSLADFLCRINSEYFTDKLGTTAKGEINTKQTLAAIRKGLKEHFYPSYPWYKNQEFQASLRASLKEMEEEGFVSPDHFFVCVDSMLGRLDYYSLESYERDDVKEILERAVFSEPWHYLVYDEHFKNRYLMKLHKKLIKELKKKKITTEKIEAI